jgi:adenylylsulfate kinase
MVIWLTGLSASGKTTIGRRMVALWRETAPGTVLVDGDEVRRLMDAGAGGDEDAYSLPARRMVAGRIAALCGWLDGQGINVVCCTISLFGDLHALNRARFSRYFEVFIDVPIEIAEKRDPNGLYAAARRGERRNVIGIDLPFAPPAAPDLVIDNSADCADPGVLARDILNRALAA